MQFGERRQNPYYPTSVHNYYTWFTSQTSDPSACCSGDDATKFKRSAILSSHVVLSPSFLHVATNILLCTQTKFIWPALSEIASFPVHRCSLKVLDSHSRLAEYFSSQFGLSERCDGKFKTDRASSCSGETPSSRSLFLPLITSRDMYTIVRR